MRTLPTASRLLALTAALGLTLGACSSNTDDAATAAPSDQATASATASGGHDASNDDASSEDASDDDHMAGHDHPADGGPAPEGIAEASDATYPVGTQVRLTADHMPGMDGATATVVGAYDTTTYSVSYQPTDGGPEVTDHRWVVHEELRDPGEAPLADGTPITIEAEHMAGMQGAEGTVDYSTQETVYMVDVTGTDGMEMTNHKWVTESEMQPLD